MQKRAGYLYCAIGKKFADLARTSARSLRQTQADAFLEIHTDQDVEFGLFDRVVPVSVDTSNLIQVKLQKILAIKNTFLEHFLYLDCDTYILQRLDPMFGLLDSYDLAACYDWWRNTSPFWMSITLNSGVMLFPKRERAAELASAWETEFLADPYLPIHGNPVRDQPALERAIARTSARVFILPLEFNFRFNEPSKIAGAVRILHGHWRTADELRRLGDFVNQDLGGRTFDPDTGVMMAPSPETRKYYVFDRNVSAYATARDISGLLNRLQTAADALRADQQAKEGLIQNLTRNLEQIEADRRAKDELISKVTQELAAVDADRHAKDDVIHRLSRELEAVEADRRAKDELIGRVTQELAAVEADRRAKDELIGRVTQELAAVEGDRHAKDLLIHRLSRERQEIEADRRSKEELISRVVPQLEAAQADQRAKEELLRTFARQLEEVGADGHAKEEGIHRLHRDPQHTNANPTSKD